MRRLRRGTVLHADDAAEQVRAAARVFEHLGHGGVASRAGMRGIGRCGQPPADEGRLAEPVAVRRVARQVGQLVLGQDPHVGVQPEAHLRKRGDQSVDHRLGQDAEVLRDELDVVGAQPPEQRLDHVTCEMPRGLVVAQPGPARERDVHSWARHNVVSS